MNGTWKVAGAQTENSGKCQNTPRLKLRPPRVVGGDDMTWYEWKAEAKETRLRQRGEPDNRSARDGEGEPRQQYKRE